MAPQFAAAAEQLFPEFILAKLNTEAEPTLASAWRIQGIPCLVLLQAGREIARQSGLMNAPQITAWARQVLKDSPRRN
jgi:thioredoxin 2